MSNPVGEESIILPILNTRKLRLRRDVSYLKSPAKDANRGKLWLPNSQLASWDTFLLYILLRKLIGASTSEGRGPSSTLPRFHRAKKVVVVCGTLCQPRDHHRDPSRTCCMQQNVDLRPYFNGSETRALFTKLCPLAVPFPFNTHTHSHHLLLLCL